MKKLLIAFLSLSFINSYAQTDSTKNPLKISGYLETYYSYDFGNPSNHERPSFFCSFNKHNEVNLNIGFLKASYNTDKIRGNFAIMAGTYSQYNLAGEQGLLKNIFEANAGFKISKKHNLWVDMGIMPSHIGFESAIGKDCWNLTRSILADNSPYFESGVKLGYTSKNDQLYFAAMYLNGWQRIQRVPYNQTPAFGTQLTYKPNAKITLNWSTYLGNEQPDTVKKWRYFNNFYGQFQVSSKFAITAGFDIGMQQKRDTSDLLNGISTWYSPVLILRYELNSKLKIAVRGEYYADENGVIISTGTTNGFQTYGYSMNLDYLIRNNMIWRIEGRGLSSKDKIFLMDGKPFNQNYFLTTSLAISF